jgi:hypothetical protein
MSHVSIQPCDQIGDDFCAIRLVHRLVTGAGVQFVSDIGDASATVRRDQR